MTVLSAPPLHSAHDHPWVTNARTTSLVVFGLWALTRAMETGVTLYVRHAVLNPPPQ